MARFFEELPSAVVAYSFAIGCASLAAIIARVAIRLYVGI
jgi:hypothetical protein